MALGAARFGRRTPAPTVGPPRSFPPFSSVGLHRWGCVIGKVGHPERDDAAAVQQYVDLREEDPSLVFCSAVRKVADSLGGDTDKHYERLRKKIPRQEKRGQLPKARTRAGLVEQRVAQIEARFRLRDVETARAQEQYALTGKEAQSLGIDPDDDLSSLAVDLDRRKAFLEIMIGTPDIAYEQLLRSGMTFFDKESVTAFIVSATDELKMVKKKIEVTAKLLNLRLFLRLDPMLFT